MSSNFSSVGTRHLCFGFLFIKSLVLCLFTKMWIVRLLWTFSSRNLRRNFRRHFLADPHTPPWSTTTLTVTQHKWLNGPITAAYCWQIKSYASSALLAVEHYDVKRSTSQLLPINPNVIGHQACWFIGKNRMRLPPRGAPVAFRSREPYNNVKRKLPVFSTSGFASSMTSARCLHDFLI
jgi:hypothetical protein